MKVISLVAIVLVFFVSISNASENDNAIGYKDVETAYNALIDDENATLTEYEGWSVFKQNAEGYYVLWSFTPDFHPAHPSAIRRKIQQKDGQLEIEMGALCFAEKEYCDHLVDQFKVINKNLLDKAAES